ncbi:MAG: aminotransferase class V-fold PLP-dependent enzyme [Gemmatimonadaceae bacterium]
MTLDDIIAREFPRLLGDHIYLNSASTGPLPESAVRTAHAHAEMRREPWRYPADAQFAILDRSRQLVADLIGATPAEIALMVNTTYGLNLAARSLPFRAGDVIVGSERDFPANVYPWMGLARDRGIEFRQVPCNGRLFDEAALLAELDDRRVRALAVSWVSFESGMRLDLDTLGRACRERGVFFVVDAIQGLGPLTLDLRKTPVDILSCGTQKWLLSPWGSAFVYVRAELVEQLEPQQVGWMSVTGSDDFTQLLDYNLEYRPDARRFEVITLPYPDFAVMNESLAIFHEAGPSAIAERIVQRTDRIVEWAQSRSDVRLVTPADRARRAGIVAVAPRDPIAASNQLTALGVSHSLREGAIRLSPHFFTPADHVDRALRAMEDGP